jgi:hypothetical protein
MKLFLKDLTLFLVIQAVLAAVLLSGFRVNDRHYLAAEYDKLSLLDQQESPRIIFVGGSNLALGIDSRAIEQSLGYHPVNMGLSLGLGVEYMLREVWQGLRPGDVVVVSLEYEYFDDSFDFSEPLFYLLEIRPASFSLLSWQQIRTLMDRGLVWVGHLARRSRRSLTEPAQSESPENPYSRDAFNAYGDLIAHRTMAPRDISKREIFKPGEVTGDFRKVINRLNVFADACKARGVTVLYSYPVIPTAQFEKWQGNINRIHARLSTDINFPIIDSPAQRHLPSNHFFDMVYHLCITGIDKRTTMLIDDLTSYLPDPP